jgi:hypothetical protein
MHVQQSGVSLRCKVVTSFPIVDAPLARDGSEFEKFMKKQEEYKPDAKALGSGKEAALDDDTSFFVKIQKMMIEAGIESESWDKLATWWNTFARSALLKEATRGKCTYSRYFQFKQDKGAKGVKLLSEMTAKLTPEKEHNKDFRGYKEVENGEALLFYKTTEFRQVKSNENNGYEIVAGEMSSAQLDIPEVAGGKRQWNITFTGSHVQHTVEKYAVIVPSATQGAVTGWAEDEPEKTVLDIVLQKFRELIGQTKAVVPVDAGGGFGGGGGASSRPWEHASSACPTWWHGGGGCASSET